MEETKWTRIKSPVGDLGLVWKDDGLSAIHFLAKGKEEVALLKGLESKTPFKETIQQLAAYFSGELKEFNLPLRPEGTNFQIKVWGALGEIPYGTTLSYGELAKKIGNPKSVRAVGAANGRNPLPLVIPCHRVIGSNGELVGFGGGIEIKRKLLQLEGVLIC